MRGLVQSRSYSRHDENATKDVSILDESIGVDLIIAAKQAGALASGASWEEKDKL